MAWSSASLADIIAHGLKDRAQAEDREQSVYGFDAGDELDLHPVVQASLREQGLGVWPEQRYPADRLRPKRTEGKRCDIVLTQDGLPLRDPLIKGTLFDTLPAADAEQAYWLEIKTVAQFTTEGPAKRYAAELLSPAPEDVKKLWADSHIAHAGLLLILFTADQITADRDLTTWHQRCIERGYPVAMPYIRGFSMTDRIGNAWCAAALFTVRGG